ncbi:MAG: YvcK family protein [Candidatus Omnitrophota bacterium]|nr:MAG: YvcK family protein [Candidatus Omnitrophota bacterium]
MDRKRIVLKIRNILKPLKWFYPGMKVKRWLLLSFIGVILIVAGGQFLSGPTAVFRMVGIIYMFFGIAIIFFGVRRIVASFITIFLPRREQELVDIVYQKRHLSKGYRIAVIGGGTGLSVLLHGLKRYTSNISAIVTVADEGGSSGKLREDFGILPPGDIRNCLVALADTEPLMSDLFQYRFSESSALKGHSFGNIFLLAMSKVTKDFEEAVKESSKILAIRGEVIPSTLERIRLIAELEDGSKELGETHISKSPKPIKRISLIPARCAATNSAIEAIKTAEVIIFGPGSLYTSIMPNLLVDGICESISESGAIKIYICNVMTQPGETDNYSASDHIKALLSNTKIGPIDYAIVNNATPPQELLSKYGRQKAYPVKPDTDNIKSIGITAVEDNVIDARDYVRHNPYRLAKVIVDIISIAKTEAVHES